MRQLNMRQQGASLIVALIFLLVLTVAGLTAVRFAILEERMASNMQFKHSAFQLARSETEVWLSEFHGLVLKGEAGAMGKAYETSASQDLPAKTTAENADINGKVGYLNSSCRNEKGSSEGGDEFSCMNFELSVVAKMEGGAASSQVQGFTLMNQ